MMHRPLATAAAAALVLVLPVGAACTGGGDGDEGALRSPSTEPTASPTTTPGDAEGGGETTAPADATDATEPSDAGSGTGGGDVPQDAAQDVELRTPGGVTLTVTGLSFDGDDILVDAEFQNGQPSLEIDLWSSARGSENLRLVDDAGQEYPLIETTDPGSPSTEELTELEPGESVSGTFAFRGPLAGQPDSISLVTNLDPEDIPSYSLDEQTETYFPGFVVPMELTW